MPEARRHMQAHHWKSSMKPRNLLTHLHHMAKARHLGHHPGPGCLLMIFDCVVRTPMQASTLSATPGREKLGIMLIISSSAKNSICHTASVHDLLAAEACWNRSMPAISAQTRQITHIKRPTMTGLPTSKELNSGCIRNPALQAEAACHMQFTSAQKCVAAKASSKHRSSLHCPCRRTAAVLSTVLLLQQEAASRR